MADNIFDKLKKMFSTGTVIRRVGKNMIKVVDTDEIQSYRTNLRDRHTGLRGGPSGTGQLRDFTRAYNINRLVLFRDYDQMDNDPIISSALDIYADESTVRNEFGDILKITSKDEEVRKLLHNLFYEVLNLEFNLWAWVRMLTKYGDFFLGLEISEELGVMRGLPESPYGMLRIEDPSDLEKISFIKQTDNPGEKKLWDNYEMAHFRLLSDTNFLPYGKAMVENARKIWKQISLMEDAMIIHRIVRAPEKRVFGIDIGNIKPSEVDAHMENIISKMKRIPFVDPATGDYNLKYNIMNITEDYYLPKRGSDSGTSIDTLQGMEYNVIDDIEYLRNKLLAGLKIPKAFLGYDESVSGKATLAAEDIRFARTIERIQRIVVSELTKIAIIHLLVHKIDGSKLVDFKLELTIPSTIYKQEIIQLWTESTRLAASIKELKMIPESWIYEKIWGFSEDEWKKHRLEVLKDLALDFRKLQIQEGGNDPAKGDIPPDQIVSPSGTGAGTTTNNAEGRPPEGIKKDTDKDAFGRDSVGDKERKSAGSRSSAERGVSKEIRDIINRFQGSESIKTLLSEDKLIDESISDLLNKHNITDDDIDINE